MRPTCAQNSQVRPLDQAVPTVQVYTGPCNQVAALRDLYLGGHRFSKVTFEQWNTKLDHAKVEITNERCVLNG